MSQITHATGVVYNQLGRLKLLDGKFASMETSFLEQIAANIKAGNNARAKILETELINVRRLRRNTQHTGLALEAVVIRFSTINELDRKSTRLNSSHANISYAGFCLKKT